MLTSEGDSQRSLNTINDLLSCRFLLASQRCYSLRALHRLCGEQHFSSPCRIKIHALTNKWPCAGRVILQSNNGQHFAGKGGGDSEVQAGEALTDHASPSPRSSQRLEENCVNVPGEGKLPPGKHELQAAQVLAAMEEIGWVCKRKGRPPVIAVTNKNCCRVSQLSCFSSDLW